MPVFLLVSVITLVSFRRLKLNWQPGGCALPLRHRQLIGGERIAAAKFGCCVSVCGRRRIGGPLKSGVDNFSRSAAKLSATVTADSVPCVSILIPLHNRLDLTRACLDSLFATADPSVPSEVLVIDDQSDDGTAEYLAALAPRVHTIRNATRECFGHNINLAAPLARGEYLCLLNNDTLVTPRWLKRLVTVARKDPAIGVVGNRHLTPGTDLLNHAGIVFDAAGHPVHLYPGQPANFPPALVSREFQCVTGACWLVERRLFLDLGGFDLQFKNGYEDVDFCLRVRRHGRKVFYAADSLIYHYGQQSPGRMDNDVLNAFAFERKWGMHIVSDLHDYLVRDGLMAKADTPPTLIKAEPQRSLPSIAVGATELHFATPLELPNAFSWVIARLALACEEAGIAVSLREGRIDRTIDAPDRSRLQKLMARPASRRAHVRWAHYWRPHFEQELSGRINAELFVHNYRYGPQPAEKLDYWMRHVATNRFRKLASSRFCRAALQEAGVPPDRCRIVPYGFSPEILKDDVADDRYRRRGYVFLAITNSHDPNRYGTDILLKAFHQAFAGRNDVVLVVKDYGSNGAIIRAWVREFAAGCQIIHLDTFLTKRALIALYRGADAFVAPFRGEGFGMKILDACAVGLPVVAPHYGGPADFLRLGDFFALKYREVPVGPCLDRNESVVPDFAVWAEVDCDDLARQLQHVVTNAEEARLRSARNREFVLQEFSWQRAAEHLAKAICDFERDREVVVASRCSVAESKNLSVVIPTYNRKTELAICLQAYERQNLPKDAWELLLVDDGSNYDVQGTVAEFERTLPVKLLSGGSNKGPGPARNLAILQAKGTIIVITGDDIIPSPQFLEQHLVVHDRHAETTFAALGHIDWHPSIKVTPLMEFVTADGGYQFAFNCLVPNSFVPHGYFYASNVSLKRALLLEHEELFSDQFRLVALEDGEFGYRLMRSGMKLFYAPSATATHFHAMSDQYIYQRQYRVGRMLVTQALLHPYLIERKHRHAIRWLDMLQHVAGGKISESLGLKTANGFDGNDHWLQHLERQLLAFDVADRDAVRAPEWAVRNYHDVIQRAAALKRQVFTLRIERAMLDGMADEWFGVEQGTPNPARDFLHHLMYADLLKPAVVALAAGSGRPDRLSYIEALRTKRPRVASLLRTIVRLSTSIAKRLN